MLIVAVCGFGFPLILASVFHLQQVDLKLLVQLPLLLQFGISRVQVILRGL
jgi:hypothetical protein